MIPTPSMVLAKERVLAQVNRHDGDGGVFSPELRVVKAHSPVIKVSNKTKTKV